ncbi:MAG: type VI secretion system baseplate subunit TssK [Planctomycetota bacterium]
MHFPPPVHWSEGLFLTPQHMQALSRYFEGRVAETVLRATPYAWGLSRLEIDDAALENFELKLRRLDAVLEDGTRVRVPEDCEVPVRSLKEHFATGRETVEVTIGVPEYALRSSNVSEAGADAKEVRRFRVIVRQELDENTGRNERAVAFRQLQARVLLGDEDRAGYHCLRLARLVLTGEADPKPARLAGDLPPLIRLGGDARLHRHLDELASMLGAKARSLADQVAQRRIHFGGEGGGGDAEMLWKLAVVNASLAVLRPLAKTPDLHPFEAFLAISRLVGELAIFGPERVVPELGYYEHTEQGRCFDALSREARRLLEAIIPTSFKRRSFEPAPEGKACALDEDWLGAGVAVYLAVEGDIEVDALTKKMSAVKMCAPSAVAALQRDRLAGIERTPVRKVPPELPDRPNLHYYQVRREGDVWSVARDERQLAIFGPAVSDANLSYSLYVVSGRGE